MHAFPEIPHGGVGAGTSGPLVDEWPHVELNVFKLSGLNGVAVCTSKLVSR